MKLIALFFLAASAGAQDVIIRADGSQHQGRVISADEKTLTIEMRVMPDRPPAMAVIPRQAVARVQFATDAEEQQLLAAGASADPLKVAARWRARLPLLALPESNAGAVGLLYAEQLLLASDARSHRAALEVIERIRSTDWNQERRQLAAQQRLRAMIALGQIEQATREAEQLAKSTSDPRIIAEVKFVLAETSFAKLRQLVADNPRWEEDDRVRPERHRLYHQALDDYLFATLFAGADGTAAPRGLWGAAALYQAVGEPERAAPLAQDIVMLYPNSEFAPRARQLLDAAGKKPNADHEKKTKPQ